MALFSMAAESAVLPVVRPLTDGAAAALAGVQFVSGLLLAAEFCASAGDTANNPAKAAAMK